MRITKLKKVEATGHYTFNVVTADGITIRRLIYRPESGAILSPMARKGFGGYYPLLKIQPVAVKRLRERLDREIIT